HGNVHFMCGKRFGYTSGFHRVIVWEFTFMPDAQAGPPSGSAIDSNLQENRLFPPPQQFAAKAQVKSLDEYRRVYRESIDNPEKFWGDAAAQLHWFKRWNKVLEWNPPYAKWFVGGTTNL